MYLLAAICPSVEDRVLMRGTKTPRATSTASCPHIQSPMFKRQTLERWFSHQQREKHERLQLQKKCLKKEIHPAESKAALKPRHLEQSRSIAAPRRTRFSWSLRTYINSIQGIQKLRISPDKRLTCQYQEWFPRNHRPSELLIFILCKQSSYLPTYLRAISSCS